MSIYTLSRARRVRGVGIHILICIKRGLRWITKAENPFSFLLFLRNESPMIYHVPNLRRCELLASPTPRVGEDTKSIWGEGRAGWGGSRVNTERQTEARLQIKAETHSQTCTLLFTNLQSHTLHTHVHPDTHEYRQTDRHTDRQKDIQTDTQTENLVFSDPNDHNTFIQFNDWI